ncbi:MAG: hypothetical protein QXQ53_01150 [Candidatus Methanosuratincola sp.]
MTLSTMINNLLLFIPGLTPTTCRALLNVAYERLSLLDWACLETIETIHTVAPYTTGTASVNSSGVVTGIGTSWSPSMEGSFMRIHYSDAFFRIASVSSPTSLTLEGWTGETTSSAPYTIFKTLYTLPSTISHIKSINYNLSLLKRDIQDLNAFDPSRLISGEPLWWAYHGTDSSNNLIIEIYPIPNATYPLRIYGKRRTTPLTEDDDTPLLNEPLILQAAIVDAILIRMQQEPTNPTWSRLYETHLVRYQTIFDSAREADFLSYSHRSRVRDVMDIPTYPPSDTFWATHDVE